MMEWVKIIVSILSGLAVCIPLVIQLVTQSQKVIKEKNWAKIVDAALGYMKTAEKNFDDGASRKEWVMSMVEQAAKSIDYDLDDAAKASISALIDSMCDMAKVVNASASIPTKN